MTQQSAEDRYLDQRIAAALAPMAARLATLEAAPRLALRYIARAVAWAHGDTTTRTITYGAFETDGEAWEALRVLSKDPPSGFNGVDQCSVKPGFVVIAGDVVRVVALGEVIAGGSK